MIYKNPVIKGFYPDPSVCSAEGRYYLVTSSFQYFPGVPLFESDDLVNWKQTGHVLTRESQLPLAKTGSSGGIYAPTIRYNAGRFYMVTTNVSINTNFYVWTDDIRGEWSEPIKVAQDGIDPSLYFEDGRAYFMSNGTDDFGDSGITQCEIDIATGEKLSPSKTIWHGSGGRYLESPHLYKIGGWYYIVAAEGGTEYGHMVTCARSREIFGEHESCPFNPVLTNRNLGGFEIQGVGHGDLVRRHDTGEWFIMHLGFRQAGQWEPYHHLGRETFLTPVTFREDGWFTAGKDGTVTREFEIQGDFAQDTALPADFASPCDWVYLRNPDMANYDLSADRYILRGTDVTLDEADSPTFIGVRQRDFCGSLGVSVSSDGAETGVTVYMDEHHRYDLAIRPCASGYEAVLRLTIGSAQYVRKAVQLSRNAAKLRIGFSSQCYAFSVTDGDNTHDFGIMETRYVSSEVAGGFTGVVFGLYAVGGIGTATDFSLGYE